jgi:predicted Rossmann fold nucleotide-binding protein DprA/Smf involved in DNA uptake
MTVNLNQIAITGNLTRELHADGPTIAVMPCAPERPYPREMGPLLDAL